MAILVSLLAASTQLPARATTAPQRTFFLHGSEARTANVDPDLDAEALLFDEIAPKGTQARVVQDVPVFEGRGGFLRSEPEWTGTIGGLITSIRFDLWITPTTPVAFSRSLSAWLGVGPARYALGCAPSVTAASPAASPEQHSFTFTSTYAGGSASPMRIETSDDGVPLPVTITLYPDCATTGSAIWFDSEQTPSSFTVNVPMPVTTPSPTPTATAEPVPAGCAVPAAADPYASCQWALGKLRVQEAWQLRNGSGEGIKVAVIDSGVDDDHPDLGCEGKLMAPSGTRDEDDQDGHGTAVAGIVAACPGNRLGMIGVAPAAAVASYRVFGGEALPLPDAIRLAAAEGAHVINLSVGYRGTGVVNALALDELFGLEDAIADAVEQGAVVVAAAGNDQYLCVNSFEVTCVVRWAAGLDARHRLPCDSPAIAREAVCVAATDRDDRMASYSNDADKFLTDRDTFALVAPGGDYSDGCPDFDSWIFSLHLHAATWCGGPLGYREFGGTSAASPHVAGVAALMYSRLGGQRSREAVSTIRRALMTTAKDLGEKGYDTTFGHGLVQAAPAVSALRTRTTLSLSSRQEGAATLALRADLREGQGRPAGGEPVQFFCDDVSFGELATGADGQIEIATPATCRGRGHTFSALYEGDEDLAASEAVLPG